MTFSVIMATVIVPVALAGAPCTVCPPNRVTDVLNTQAPRGATTHALRDTVPVDPFDRDDAIPYPADSLLIALTPDLLTRFTQVWTVIQRDSGTLKDPIDLVDSLPFVFNDSIRMPKALAGQFGGVLLHNEHGWQKFPAFPPIAAKFPKVADAIKRSGLNDTQLLRIARSLSLAWSMNRYMVVTMADTGGVATGSGLQVKTTVHPDTTTLRGKNLHFYREHQPQIDRLNLWW